MQEVNTYKRDLPHGKHLLGIHTWIVCMQISHSGNFITSQATSCCIIVIQTIPESVSLKRFRSSGYKAGRVGRIVEGFAFPMQTFVFCLLQS